MAGGSIGNLASGHLNINNSPERKPHETDRQESLSPLEQIAEETGQSPLVLMVQAKASQIMQNASASAPMPQAGDQFLGSTYGSNTEAGLSPGNTLNQLV